ncbi:GTP-binding protein REM 1 [Microplitis demolitor]|uniref:GTP-binding protein REM 1 n=1 Tax=Microplitis demolitor TaxID=69319 RepID=UPI0006D513A1|nr:GTP-binding protein REM 1 [Microplitis demolitor]
MWNISFSNKAHKIKKGSGDISNLRNAVADVLQERAQVRTIFRKIFPITVIFNPCTIYCNRLTAVICFIQFIGLINRGDSFRRKPSKASSLPHSKKSGDQNEPKLLKEIVSYTIGMLGGPGVGKTALISQFMTSECINAYDRQRDETKEESVFVMLNGEETELKFANVSDLKAQFEKENQPDAYIIMYSVIDRASFQQAEELLSKLHVQNVLRIRPAILVGNKIDLVRSRAVTFQDGKYSAYTYHAKFIEISVGINHNVDELLVGVLHQIRLKRQIYNHSSNVGDLEKITKSNHWYKSKSMMRATVKAHRVLTWLFKKDDNKFKNCENLHVL